jgi:hypothetical protein
MKAGWRRGVWAAPWMQELRSSGRGFDRIAAEADSDAGKKMARLLPRRTAPAQTPKGLLAASMKSRPRQNKALHFHSQLGRNVLSFFARNGRCTGWKNQARSTAFPALECL